MSFTLIEERQVQEIASIVRLYTHDQTGARLLSVINADENKCFGISFRTPPEHSDGVAHILEHSVLCGSRKYPVKEPFVELMKGSLNTFLNAMTFPDKTVYPVASTNLKDFRNLVDVYLDAVFYPRITEDTFRQEGWHYEVDESTGELSIKGVVYNEMKGAYSDPEDLHADLCRRSLFPDTAYGLDSGGDPAVIPTLTYEQFKKFYQTYYHPSNSFIFFYGDDDPEERLALLDEWLAPYSAQKIESLPGIQKPFTAPVSLAVPFSSEENKAYTAINWALREHGDQEFNLAVGILSHILTGTPASPLRKALIESGLGEDLAGFGLEDGLRVSAYSVGLKGVAPERVGDVEKLIRTTLKNLVAQGIDPDTIEASVNTIEFALREKNTGRFPKGLAVMLEALGEWLYDHNPIDALIFEPSLSAIKARLASKERYFENLIQTLFIDNKHASVVTLLPDAEIEARRSAEEAKKMAEIKAQLSELDIANIKQEAEHLKKLQQTPDSPEALSTIPSLALSDIPTQAPRIPLEIFENGGQTTLFHDLPTSGILYLDLAFPFSHIESRLLPYLSIFGRALLEMGTDTEDYVTLSQEIGKHTGGIGASAFAATRYGSAEAVSAFMVRGKTLLENSEKFFSLLEKVLLKSNFSNRERFRQIVLEEKAQAEASVIPSGHRLIGLRLKSKLTRADWISERINGLENIFFLRRLAERIEHEWEAVEQDLRALRDNIIARNGLIVNVTVDHENYRSLKTSVEDFVSHLPQRAAKNEEGIASIAVQAELEVSAHQPGRAEALTAPTQVNFVGKAFPLGTAGARLPASFQVVKKYLDTTFLWEKVRVQGGAYGGFSVLDMNAGIMLFLSYRDPNLVDTLAIYDQAAEFLSGLEISQEELTKSIIGTIGDVDSYQLPDAKGFTSMMHYLTGYSQDIKQKTRDEILATGAHDFVKLADALRQARPQALEAMLTSKSTLDTLDSSQKARLEISPLF